MSEVFLQQRKLIIFCQLGDFWKTLGWSISSDNGGKSVGVVHQQIKLESVLWSGAESCQRRAQGEK